MNRREFFKSVLAKAAATGLVATSLRAAVKRQLDALAEDDDTPAPTILNWTNPVETKAQLPGGVPEGTALTVAEDDEAYIFIADVGWLPLTVVPRESEDWRARMVRETEGMKPGEILDHLAANPEDA